MTRHILSLIALVVALVSLTFALSARRQRDTTQAEASAAVERVMQQVHGPAKQKDDVVSLSSRLAVLNERLDRLEKEIRSDDQLRLLTEISAQLQTTAEKADKGARDLEGVRRSVQTTVGMTQASMNAVAMELSSIKEELKKKADAK
jgi:hypothetical protein